jgi:hypothetical protein
MISMRAVVLSRSSPRLATTASFFDGTQPFIPTGPSHSTKFEQVIKTTQTLDGNIVPRLLAPADEVIERLPCLFMAVRPEGANHLWRKNPPRELSIDLVTDGRLGRVTGRAGAS